MNALMKRVPKGRVVTINELRDALAAKHRTDFACPITTGIAGLRTRLEAEGHKVQKKGRRYFVADFEKRLFKKLV